MTTGEVRIESDGTPWRPLVHIEDIRRAFIAVLEAPRELVHDEAFNVGRSEDVVQVRDIAEMVREAVPDSTLSFADGAGPDLRNYKVDFAKLHDTFPDLELEWTVRKGVEELAAAYAAARADARRLRLGPVRPAAPDPAAARRRAGRRPAPSATTDGPVPRPAGVDSSGNEQSAKGD